MDGTQIREMRKARGWTQTELAERIGVTFSAISKIEKGHRNAGGSARILLEQMWRRYQSRPAPQQSAAE
ncbi:MAG: helix-turn-helix transcriptional regulator [Rhodobacteraceae bacterium]|nr:helix-turn-helix transcriptional regulator [Paracoccaceae bacterium]